MTTKSQLFEGLSATGEKSAVVLDIGAAYTKIGFAGEIRPRNILPSVVKRAQSGNLVKIASDEAAQDLYQILVEFLHNIYFRHLLVNPRDRRVVICESMLCPTEFRNTLARALFKHYEVPSTLFAPFHLMAIFTLAIDTALVIDSGYKETLVIPIYEGIPIIKAWQSLPVGGEAIHRCLEEKLLEKGVVKSEKSETKPLSSLLNKVPETVLEDIKVRACFVTNLQRAQAIHQSTIQGNTDKLLAAPPPVDYPLDGEVMVKVSGEIRESSCEVLFQQDNEETSIATLLLESILQCPLDMRYQLAENVVCIGGTCMTPGFRHRLLSEVEHLLTLPKYKSRLAITTIKMHNPLGKENYAAWLGGAIFGALEVFPMRSLSKEVYNKTGKVPDWSSLEEPFNESTDASSVAIRDRLSIARKLSSIEKAS